MHLGSWAKIDLASTLLEREAGWLSQKMSAGQVRMIEKNDKGRIIGSNYLKQGSCPAYLTEGHNMGKNYGYHSNGLVC